MASDRRGFLGTLRDLVASPIEGRLLRLEEARHHRLALQAETRILEQVVRRVEPEHDGFVPIDSYGDKRQLDAGEQQTLREQALRASLHSPNLVGYLRNLNRFVVGVGPQFVPEVEDERLQGRILEWFRQFHRVNRWNELEDEIPHRTWRDGEVFLWHTVQTAAPLTWPTDDAVTRRLQGAGVNPADLKPREEVPAGMLLLRLVPPEHIQDPQGVVTHGIITAQDDVRTVLGYCRSPDGKALEVIPAAQMRHIKIRVDSDVKRGRSLLEPLLKRDRQHDDWLEARILLSVFRSSVVWVKKVEGTPAQVRAVRDAQGTTRDHPTNDRRLRAMKPGTTIHANKGIEYEFKNPNLAAQDARHDGRAIQLTMAAASGMPEYMFTGDASNANFASTMVAESPAVREFETWQDFFEPEFSGIHSDALVAAASANAIEGLSEDAARAITIRTDWPPLMSRDELKHAQRNAILASGGVLSLEGWAVDEGIDWTEEKERIARERAEWADDDLADEDEQERVRRAQEAAARN